MKLRVHFENKKSTLGGYEIVSIWKLFRWIFFGKIKPKENSDRYYIRKIETLNKRRI